MTTTTEIPKVFRIHGRNLVQLPSTPSSGLFKFKDVSDGEIFLYETCELSKETVAQLEPLLLRRDVEQQYIFNVTRINKNLYGIKTTYNEFQMKVDAVKGIGIYLMCPSGTLIKQYRHTKIEMGLNWIIKNYTNFSL